MHKSKLFNFKFTHLVVDDAKCILVTRVCPHYCTDPDVTWGVVVVHYWADLQSVHGFRCCNNIQVCKLIASYTANAYSGERGMSVSACLYSLYA